METVTLEQALAKVEDLTKENSKLKKRVIFLEDMMYNDTMSEYDSYDVDEYDPIFD